MKPYLAHEHPLRFAHRGSRVLWPENTMTAFQGAVDLGYRYIETDVHVTRDGKVVVFHDDHLERLTDGRGRVWEWRWEDLRRLDAGYHFDPAQGYPLRGSGISIPLLEEVLKAFPDQLFNLDLKQESIESVVADEIERFAARERVLVGSFYDRRVQRFRAASKGLVATSAGPREVAAALISARFGRALGGEADAYQVPPRERRVPVVTRRFVDAAHRAGKQVHSWTINDAPEMVRLLDLGVDGVITDRPDILNEVIARRTVT